jgi:DNA polymerase family A/3'-5' exonuclease
MKIVTIDFESHYDDVYSLSKLTTEEYIRDPRFEAIMVGYKVDDGRTGYAVGAGAIQTLLDSFELQNCAVLCHHAHFDGLILSHHFGIKPAVWFDTLSMARALHGTEVGGSLGKLLEHYQVGITKGTFVVDAKGKHLADFSAEQLAHYGRYCCDDVEGTYRIFSKMVVDGFPKKELKQIDLLVRMFTEPQLELDESYLRAYATDIQANKLTLLFSAGVTKEEVMSNDKFAEALKRLGVTPPLKTSPTTGQPAWAFAKTDQGLLDLLEHPNIAVQTLVAARLGNKSTINETRALRMADMAPRGPTPMYYKYAGAMQTMRVSGGDSLNWQNLERVAYEDDGVTLKKGQLRMSIYAPEGYSIVVVDSSNIEARILDWLADQENMLDAYRKFDRGEGPDIYCVVASGLYGKEITKKDKMERMLGKVVKLACGYQMGPERFMDTARVWSEGKLLLTFQQANDGVQGYRATHPMVEQLWNRAQSALGALASGPDEDDATLDMHGLLRIEKGAIRLPNGLKLKYPQMSYEKDTGWSFAGGRGQGRLHIYGGKIIENVVQALAKIVVMDQLLDAHDVIKRTYNLPHCIKMTTHDEGCFVVPDAVAEDVLKTALFAMSTPPAWAPTLPVAAAGSIAIRYGEAK